MEKGNFGKRRTEQIKKEQTPSLGSDNAEAEQPEENITETPEEHERRLWPSKMRHPSAG